MSEDELWKRIGKARIDDSPWTFDFWLVSVFFEHPECPPLSKGDEAELWAEKKAKEVIGALVRAVSGPTTEGR